MLRIFHVPMGAGNVVEPGVIGKTRQDLPVLEHVEHLLFRVDLHDARLEFLTHRQKTAVLGERGDDQRVGDVGHAHGVVRVNGVQVERGIEPAQEITLGVETFGEEFAEGRVRQRLLFALRGAVVGDRADLCRVGGGDRVGTVRLDAAHLGQGGE